MRLLSAVLAERSVTSLRDIDPEVHFADQQSEKDAYYFIRDHHDTHRVLPTYDVVAENTGVVLPEVDQPVSYYMTRVRGRSLHQAALPIYNRLQEGLQEPQTSMGQIIEAIEDLYQAKARLHDAGTGIEMSDSLIEDVMQGMRDKRMSSSILTGITTGYEELDMTMDGYQRGDLVVWVGRPGRSKSWYLLKQAHAAWNAGYKPLYVSMEMGGVQNMRRIMGIHTGVNPSLIKRGRIQTLALPGFERKIEELLELRPLHMVTANFSRTVDQIANFIDKYSPDIVYIDAGYLLSPRKKRYGSSGRRETISDVIEELKELAANTNIPFVLTVQFNRQAEHRRRGGATDAQSFNPIGHLSLAEIGETDVIGQTATHVLGIEYPPDPLPRDSHRVFGFLKGREGENGWWLTKFMQTQNQPVDLSLVPKSDPVYDAVLQHALSNSRNNGNPRNVDPNRRSAMMRLNNR